MTSATHRMFARRLKMARESRGLSQVALAKAAKITPAAISHFERGARTPSLANLLKLADALHTSTDYLVNRTDEPAGLAAADVLLRPYQNLSLGEIVATLALLESMLARLKAS